MHTQNKGSIEVIVGGMFSGKTEELILRVRRAELARQKVQVFKPHIDVRYGLQDVVSHNKNSTRAVPLQSSEEILEHLRADTQVVGIDEGQFFDDGLVDVVQALAERGVRVIVAGLDTDWQAQAFAPMPTLMAIAEQVTKKHAVCMVCGREASRTQRVAAGSDQILIGAQDIYEAPLSQPFQS